MRSFVSVRWLSNGARLSCAAAMPRVNEVNIGPGGAIRKARERIPAKALRWHALHAPIAEPPRKRRGTRVPRGAYEPAVRVQRRACVASRRLLVASFELGPAGMSVPEVSGVQLIDYLVWQVMPAAQKTLARTHAGRSRGVRACQDSTSVRPRPAKGVFKVRDGPPRERRCRGSWYGPLDSAAP
jgi:hypothetical protein